MTRPKDLDNKDGGVWEEGGKGSGKWRAQVYIDGKPVRRRATSERAANAKWRELLKMRDQGLQVGTGKMKLRAWLEVWYTLGDRKAMTNAGHRDTCERYVIPYLGDKALEAIKAHHLDEWRAKLKAQGLAAWTINGAFRRLRAALNVAVKRGMIARNPCNQVDAPPAGPRRTEVLDTAQLQKLLDTLAGDRLYALFALAGAIGPRPSELIGLRVGALLLDGDEPALVIREQLQRFKGSDGKQQTHRERSTKGGDEADPNPRTIPLSSELVAILRAYLTALKAERLKRGEGAPGPDDLLFVTARGTPINDRNLLRTLHRACKRAGVPRTSIHGLRHTAGSVMLAQGEQIVDVAAVLGHKNPNVTAEIYAHSFDAGKRSAVNAASAALLRRA